MNVQRDQVELQYLLTCVGHVSTSSASVTGQNDEGRFGVPG